MTSRLLFGFTGPLWVICGVVIGLSPPISEGRYAQRMPLLGWAIADGPGADRVDRSHRDRRRGRVWSLWHGISAGLPSSVCAGLVLLSVVPMLLPRGG